MQNYFSFLVFHHRHNRIWSGRAAGVAVTEEGKGHILYNDIYGMEWGGVDIRNGGNPVVTNNWIRDGHADGIVIGEGGKGVIMDNDIRGTEMIVHHKFNQGYLQHIFCSRLHVVYKGNYDYCSVHFCAVCGVSCRTDINKIILCITCVALNC